MAQSVKPIHSVYKSISVIGLGFGDEGKGSITDFLAHHYGLKVGVRFNGGPQAAHRVVVGQRQHIFSLFSSGLFNEELVSVLANKVIVDPLVIDQEARFLENQGVSQPLLRHIADLACLVVTPIHQIMNRIEELLRGKKRHGSCGLGIGHAFLDELEKRSVSIYLRDLLSHQKALALLNQLKLQKIEVCTNLLQDRRSIISTGLANQVDEYKEWLTKLNCEYFADQYQKTLSPLQLNDTNSFIEKNDQGIIFEGAQGLLLDMEEGFWPNVTPSFTSARNINFNSFNRENWILGVLRAYLTRHGEGVFVSEDLALTEKLPDAKNVFGEWQGNFRIGYPDMIALQYALQIQPVNAIALTCLDRLMEFKSYSICIAYKLDKKFIAEAENYFNLNENQQVIAIRKKSLSQSENLERTKLLLQCHPVYSQISFDTTEKRLGSRFKPLIEKIEEVAKVPVKIISFGEDRFAKEII